MSPWLNVNQKCKLPVIAVSKPHKYLIVKGKFLAWHESWKSPLRPNNNKKLNKLKTQQLFLAQSEKWGLSANCCLQNWGKRQASTENHKEWAETHEQKPMSSHLQGNQCEGKKTWTVIDELLEAQSEQVWDIKNSWGHQTLVYKRNSNFS